nr:hypothetical protein Iba_chr14fCG6740 [Ipomoea batatas]
MFRLHNQSIIMDGSTTISIEAPHQSHAPTETPYRKFIYTINSLYAINVSSSGLVKACEALTLYNDDEGVIVEVDEVEPQEVDGLSFHGRDIAGVLADGLWTFDQNLVVMRG